MFGLLGSPELTQETFLSYKLRAKSIKTPRKKTTFKRSACAKRCVVWGKVLRMPDMLAGLKLLLMFVSWLN